jgi:hypothetical protein
MYTSSVYFKDLLSTSEELATLDKPICIDDQMEDFLVAMSIIHGRSQEAGNLPRSYEQSKRLYKMMEKYRFDMHRPWFSAICADWVAEKPLDALFLACNRPEIDTTLAQAAILKGLANVKASKLYDPLLFEITDKRERSKPRRRPLRSLKAYQHHDSIRSGNRFQRSHGVSQDLCGYDAILLHHQRQ